jgi:ribosomal protein S21
MNKPRRVNTAYKVLNYVNVSDFRNQHEAVEKFIRNIKELGIVKEFEDRCYYIKPSEKKKLAASRSRNRLKALQQ